MTGLLALEQERRAPMTDESAAESPGAGSAEAGVLCRAQAGDETAFEALVRLHERRVLRTALRLLGRLDLAEDAAQVTFMRLYRSLRRIDPERNLAPWLYRVVVNVSRDVGRRAAGGRWVPLQTIEGGERPELRVGPEEVTRPVELDAERRLVRAALATLPEKERAAVVLRDIEGLSTREVAEILGSSEGTVRSQISTARVKIRRFVDARVEGRG
jgi:RNA polymerase sigma-70 factor (ECF subfamily)